MIASQIVGICRGYAKSYVVDMAMVIQVIRVVIGLIYLRLYRVKTCIRGY